MSRRGFTLTEILVTTVLVLLLGAVASKGYRSQMEAGRADAARSLVLLAAHGNRMAAMDNVSKSTGAAGPFLPAPGHDGLLRTPRDGRECGPPWDGAALGRCRYVGLTDWDVQPYLFRACRPDGGGGGCCRTCPKGTVACARRKMDGRGCTPEPADEGARDMSGAEPSGRSELMAGGVALRGGTGRPFCEWRYCVDASERVTALFGAP